MASKEVDGDDELIEFDEEEIIRSSLVDVEIGSLPQPTFKALLGEREASTAPATNATQTFWPPSASVNVDEIDEPLDGAAFNDEAVEGADPVSADVPAPAQTNESSPVDASEPTRDVLDLRQALNAKNRELVELREALNSRDKALLDLRVQLSHRDQEVIDARDGSLAVERQKAELDERILSVERAMADEREGNEALAAEKASAESRAEALEKTAERLAGERDEAQTQNVEHEDCIERLHETMATERDEQSVARTELEAQLALARAELGATSELIQTHQLVSGELRSLTSAIVGKLDQLDAPVAAQPGRHGGIAPEFPESVGDEDDTEEGACASDSDSHDVDSE
jgi:hypothetical protein